MPVNRDRSIKRGLILVLVALGLLAFTVYVPYVSALIGHAEHWLFIAGCGLCWTATTTPRARKLVAASAACMTLAWLLYLYLTRQIDFADLPYRAIVLGLGLRWIACGAFGWFLIERKNEDDVAVAGAMTKAIYVVVALGVVVTACGVFILNYQFSMWMMTAFLLVLLFTAYLVGERLSVMAPAGGYREFGAGSVGGDGAGAATGAPLSAADVPEGEAWRARLLASMRDCGIQRAPRARVLNWIVTFVVLFTIAAITLIGNKVIGSGMSNAPPEARGIAVLLWVAFNVFVLVRIRNRFLRKSWQVRARSAEEELQRSGSRRPILYLRSFQLDERIGRPTWMERFIGTYPLQNAEQTLTKTLRHTGPVLAIGRPDEKLPALGAARFYVSHDRWQEKVRDVAEESQLIVWATGVTEGLRWEVSHLLRSVPPERLLLWAHPHLLRVGPDEREAEWTRFRTQLGGEFPKPLPEKLGDARFVAFGPNWEPHPVGPLRNNFRSSLRTLLGAQQSALGAILAVRHGILSRSWAARFREGLGKPAAWLLIATIIAMASMSLFGDGAFIEVRDGKEFGSTGYKTLRNDSQAFRMMVDLALVAVTISLIWGRSLRWQRVRAVGIALLGLLTCFLGFYILNEMAEGDPAFSYTERDPMTGREVESHFEDRVALGGYVNMILGGVVACFAINNLIAVWRRKASDYTAVTTFPLREEDIIYSPLKEPRDFAALIGVAQTSIDWRRVAGFGAACVAFSFLQGSTLLGALFWALAITAAAVVAFRFLSRPLVAAIGAALVATLLMVHVLGRGWFLESLAVNAAFMVALAWATPRIAPLGAALGLAALCAAGTGWAYDVYVADVEVRFGSVVWDLIGAALFATTLIVVDYRTRVEAT